MDVARGGPPADELQAMIQAARDDLTTAGDTGAMRRDPYRVVLRALADVLAVFGRTITRWERATAAVVEARSPLSDAEKVAFRSELVAGMEDGAYKAMRKEAARVVRTIDRALAVRIGLLVGLAYVLGGVSVVGVLAFTAIGPFSLEGEQRAAWAPLLQNNPDPRPALASAEIRTDQTGRRYYAKLSLWLDPARPAPTAQ